MATDPEYVELDATSLRLPECPLPRPGEKVCWYADSKMVKGDFKGHDVEGRPLIVNEFGNPVSTQSFDSIRLADPFNRKAPNWAYLGPSSKIFRPPENVLTSFKDLLNQRVPPGPRYLDLCHEIWSRGFEVFVVGGTVRDIIIGQPSKDVDIVTTMPLTFMRRFIRSMYRYDPSSRQNRGFMRIGGTPESGDPFIDLKVFSDSLMGTDDATFGVGFDRDVAHRDFACNAIYFDPINAVLIDPTGFGIEDAKRNCLTLICNINDAYQHAQLFVRFFKFRLRGYIAAEATKTTVCNEFSVDVGAMNSVEKARYLKAQVLSKCESKDDWPQALMSLQEQMDECGVRHIWEAHFAPALREHLHV